MIPELYHAAFSGNIDVLMQNKEKLAVELTPNKNTVLHLVSEFGKAECVPKILEMHPSLISQTNSDDDSALHIAVRHGNYEVVQSLIQFAVSHNDELEKGHRLDKEMLIRMRNKNGETALYDAVRYNHVEVVECLTREDYDFPHNTNNAGDTPLYIAAERSYEYDDVVRVILQNCTSPGYGGSGGRTALHASIICNSKESTKRILAWNQSLVKERDERGWSPLHYAAFLGHTEGASQLLQVDTTIAYLVDSDNNTALHVAASVGEIGVTIEIMLQCPDCYDMVNGRGQNILHIALEIGEPNLVDNYIDRIIAEEGKAFDTLVTQKDVDGNTPLHVLLIAAASNYNYLSLISRFMSSFVDKNALNNENLTPLDMLNDEGQSSWDYLLGGGATAGLRNTMSLAKFKKRAINRMTSEEISKTEIRERERKRREELMKRADTAMIVAALIATVTFAAGFTMPGGYIQSGDTDAGMAVLSTNTAFQAFVIFDTIALFLSSVAIFINYWGTRLEKNNKINRNVNLISLILVAAIGAMMEAFSVGTYVVLSQSPFLVITTCVIGLLWVPTLFWMLMKFWNDPDFDRTLETTERQTLKQFQKEMKERWYELMM